ncbi:MULTISPECIES: hypothetical protein [Bradyrhizobium]|uniref:hypothetical protein n=1 Tax=Bradyrhizobium TaxID=374 RepID=UPI001F1CE2CD|nr:MULTISPECIES: hypothetical protein [Bradyrhizobium]
MKIDTPSIEPCEDMGRENLIPHDAYEKRSERRNIIYRLEKGYSEAVCDFPKLLTGFVPPPSSLVPGSAENAGDVVFAARLDNERKTAGRKPPGAGKYHAVD